MTPDFFFFPRICFAADDGAGGGAAPEDGGDAGAAPDGGAAPATPDAPAPAEPAGRWWEGNGLTDDQRARVTAMGLTVDDPVQAIAKLTDMEAAAARKLGKPADQLLDRPGSDEKLGDWMRANSELFGIPEAPDKYELNRPEGWPKDAKWNDRLEAKARQIAYNQGLSGAALQEFSDLYASEVQLLMGDAEADLAASNAEMHTELQAEFGAQYPAKVAMAQQAASVAAEMAGLDQTSMSNLAATLKPQVGDANTIKLFAAIGEMMGEDSGVALRGGGGAMGMTPAEARAERAAMMAKGGAWYEATASNNQAEMARLKPKMEHLSKLAAG